MRVKIPRPYDVLVVARKSEMVDLVSDGWELVGMAVHSLGGSSGHTEYVLRRPNPDYVVDER